MHKQLKKSVKILAGIAAILAVLPAFADITYTYTSSTLNVFSTEQSVFSDPFTISLTFSDKACLLRWSASQSGIGTLSSTNPMPINNSYRPIIYLYTSESGQPTNWFFNALTEHPGTIYWKQQIASINQVSWLGESLPNYFYDYVGWDSPPPDVHLLGGGYSYTIGTWSATGLLPRLAFRYDPNYDTLCPSVPNPDSDGDGVPDEHDLCPNTLGGAIVDANGCSIQQLVPCDGSWRSHGEYVRVLLRVSSRFVEEGLLTKAQRRAIVRDGSRSDCGKRKKQCKGVIPHKTSSN